MKTPFPQKNSILCIILFFCLISNAAANEKETQHSSGDQSPVVQTESGNVNIIIFEVAPKAQKKELNNKQENFNDPPKKELIKLIAIFTSTGERVPIRLPLDIRGDLAAQLIFEKVFLKNVSKNRLAAFDYGKLALLKGEQIITSKTLREAGLKEGNEVKIRVGIASMPFWF